jgi:Putative polyhydroxyalkanoic acid system protein (PHA_gran_rgn)
MDYSERNFPAVVLPVQDQHNATSVTMASLPGVTMSEPLVVSIPHRLGKDEALRRLKTGIAEVGTSFGHWFSVREQIWTGDHLRFEVNALGQSASGSIDVAEDYVRLEVFLPWILAKLFGTIQPLIRKEGMLLLEKK